jgi:hypothetical protein
MKLSITAAGRIAAAAVLSVVAFGASAQKTQLTVYTALETDQLKAYQAGFEKANPNIEIVWVRDSTGIITAKLLAEKSNPKADVVMGVAATSMAIFDAEGMLVPYAPKGLERIAAQYRDPKNPPAWAGMDVWGATVCFNTAEAAKRNIPKPETWRDLTKPVYKGQIVMPHPASSGTGFFDVSAWLQLWGEADGFEAVRRRGGRRVCRRDLLRVPRQSREGARRPDRPRVPEGGPRLGPRSDRHPQGNQEHGRGAEAARLGGERRSDGTVCRQLRDRCDPEPVQAAAQRARRLREPPGEERLCVGSEEPRPHPGRVEQALRVEGRAQVINLRSRSARAG